MNALAKLAGIAALSIATSPMALADLSQHPTVLTSEGVVTFVSPDISAEELSEILFPVPTKTTVSTRSIFDKDAEFGQIPVSVAMLIQFEFDSSVLTEKSKQQLNTIGTMLGTEDSDIRRLAIEGHTDIVGTEQYNMSLSFRRAESVKEYLVSAHNIASDRFDLIGRGEGMLIDLDNPKGAMNRRVQFSAAYDSK